MQCVFPLWILTLALLIFLTPRRGPLPEVHLAEVARARAGDTAEVQDLSSKVSCVCVMLLTQVRFGKDGHFRTTGDNQTLYRSVKYFLDYAKGLFE